MDSKSAALYVFLLTWVVVLTGCDRVVSYVINDEVEAGWVVVEFDNPECSGLSDDLGLGPDIPVDILRHGCTSRNLTNARLPRIVLCGHGQVTRLPLNEGYQRPQQVEVGGKHFQVFWVGVDGAKPSGAAADAVQEYMDARSAI